MASAGTLRVAVDVGGTFTDVCVHDEASGTISVAKVASTPDPLDGVLNGVEAAGIDLADVALFSHGTTVATNALITRRFPNAAMVTTAGFRDVIEIRRGTRDDLWDAYKDVAKPYIRRRDRLTITERVDSTGRVLTQVDEDEARRVAAILRARGIKTVSICFINSYANPANELRMKAVLEQELPDATISTSSDVLAEIFEHERFSTAVANAVLAPVVSDYVKRLGTRLADGGYRSELLVLHSGGGVMTPHTVEQLAVRLAASGIAAGAIAVRHLARLAGYRNAIGLDMGGTSTDISLVADGELRVTKDWHVQYGYPICFPSIEVLTIGAGGGSLAWIDQAGSLRNGPESAGATPGPACYAAGGKEPTNTDANVVLGRLGTELLGGKMQLDQELAASAIRDRIAEPLGLELHEAANAVIKVANANMADAVRLISIGRGYDPRDFALVAFGGAGSLHGAALAKELAIPTVLVPPSPGITSALGCLLVDVRHDLSTMFLARADQASPETLKLEFGKLESEGLARLRAEGIQGDAIELRRTIDMRYLGQWRSIAVEIDGALDNLEDATARFHAEHEREHKYRREDAPIEFYRLNITAIGYTGKPELPSAGRNPGKTPRPKLARLVVFDDGDAVEQTPVFDRDTLAAGTSLEGPAIIDQLDSTTVVPPGVRVEVDEWMNLKMHINAERSR